MFKEEQRKSRETWRNYLWNQDGWVDNFFNQTSLIKILIWLFAETIQVSSAAVWTTSETLSSAFTDSIFPVGSRFHLSNQMELIIAPQQFTLIQHSTNLLCVSHS